MADIAAVAGVSKDTVSRALRRRPDVRPEVRRRIQTLARQMGYRPNPLVRAFHQRASRLVGVWCTSALHLPFSSVLAGVQEALGRRDHDPVLIAPHCGHGTDGEMAVPRVVHERYLDGLIGFETIPPEIRAEIRQHGLPSVLALGDPGHEPDSRLVTVDPAAAVGMAIEHLVLRGHRRIAGVFIGEVAGDGWARSVSEANPWTRGYLRALARRGLGACVAEHPCLAADVWIEQVLRRRAGSSAPTALITQDVGGANELRGALSRRGLSVPGHISLIATSLSGTDMLDPRTYHTVIDQPWAEVGRAAADALIDRLEGLAAADWAAMQLFEPVGVLDYGTTGPAEASSPARRTHKSGDAVM